MPFTERRRFQRVSIIGQVVGKIGDVKVVVADASLSGIRVLHQGAIGEIKSSCRLIFAWDGQEVRLDCTIVRTNVKHPPKTPHDKTLYESGLMINNAPDLMRDRLRAMIEAHVLRALDERKANARGIPATAAQSFQTGKGGKLMRHELTNGKWNTIPTENARQPANGFTISAEEPLGNVVMLREAYETGDPEARRVIRQMAELSISKTEGIPTRRYEP